MKFPILYRINNWIQQAREKRPRPDEFDDFWYSRQPYESKTGIDVTEDFALTYSTVWACVKVISEDLASLPLFVYRREDKSKEKAPDHPLYWLLHDAPNAEMTAMQFRECLQAQLLTWGNAYAQIQRNIRNQPIALWPLNPAHMKVTRPDNELIYEYIVSGEKILFRKEDILHIAGLGFNGLIGYSPIRYHRDTIGVGLSAQEWQATNCKLGGRLQLAFVHPAPKAPDQEKRRDFSKRIREEYGGRKGNAIGVFWEGMKPEKIGMSMEDAQFIENRKFNRTEICAIFRVPPHKIMDLEKATYTNIEMQNINYVVDAIRPWAVRWEQAINQRLLDGSSEFFAEHSMEGLLRGDIASRYAAYAVGRQWGWLNSDEIRALENMNPLPDGKGQIYLEPLNMIEAGAERLPPMNIPDAPITDEEKEQAARIIQKLKSMAIHDPEAEAARLKLVPTGTHPGKQHRGE